MKNLFGAIAIMLVVTLAACGGEECKECTGTDPFFGIEITSMACENGDGTLTVTGTVLGITQDTTYTATLEEFVNLSEADGMNCK